MKNNRWKRRKLLIFVLTLCMLLTILPYTMLATGGQDGIGESATMREIPEDAIYLSKPEDLVELANNCRLNTWSIGKTIVLKNDINMVGVAGFNGIPVFAGTFLGQGYTIKGVTLDEEGSVVGFFRYLREYAIVEDVKLEAMIAPQGSKCVVGGFA